MRTVLLLFMGSVFALAGDLPAVATRVGQIQNVYILSMGGGMDQFLANRISRMGKFQVVADPAVADAIVTDRLGENFEKKLDELYPKPVPDTSDDDDDTADKPKEQPLRINSFARGRGTFFLVDRKTRNVVWSVYERPRNSSADELNRTADRVVNKLKHDLNGKQ